MGEGSADDGDLIVGHVVGEVAPINVIYHCPRRGRPAVFPLRQNPEVIAENMRLKEIYEDERPLSRSRGRARVSDGAIQPVPLITANHDQAGRKDDEKQIREIYALLSRLVASVILLLAGGVVQFFGWDSVYRRRRCRAFMLLTLGLLLILVGSLWQVIDFTALISWGWPAFRGPALLILPGLACNGYRP